MTLPIRIAKRIRGECLYSGCTEEALDGSDYCAPHDAHERGRDAGKKRRRRQRLADQGRCIVSGCGRKVAKRKRPNGAIQQRRCPHCSKLKLADEQEAREKRGVPGVDSGVPGDSTDKLRTREVMEADGYIRTRGVGQSRRGQQKRWQLDLQDIEDAIDRLQRAKRGILLARDAEEAQVPRVQRDEIRFEACAMARHASRFIDEVTERNGYSDSAGAGDSDEIAETRKQARR